eukprot:scaffold19856_cov130-Isochrysis_galbana.AAC.1
MLLRVLALSSTPHTRFGASVPVTPLMRANGCGGRRLVPGVACSPTPEPPAKAWATAPPSSARGRRPHATACPCSVRQTSLHGIGAPLIVCRRPSSMDSVIGILGTLSAV